jgi:signal transduction histidine kinase
MVLPRASLRRTRAPIRLARWGGLLLLVSLLTGTALFHLVYGLARLPSLPTAYLQCLIIGITYTVVMTLCLKGTAHWMRGRIPLKSRWSVALHVGIQSLGTVVSFGLATGLVWGMLGDAVPLSSDLLLSVAAVSFVTALVWNAFAYMHAFYRRLREAEAAAYDARLQALRAQVNPHFLFNAFNSITALVQTHPREAQSVVTDLADLFRYALSASRDDRATLADEIRAVRLYLSVQAVRFGDRLTIDIDVPEALGPALLPGMIVQPLVENAVKHGVCRTLAPCTIRVAARQEAGTLHLCVTDTGPGFDTTDPAVVLARGTGLANVRERLQHFFDGAASLRLHPQGVELRAPLYDVRGDT